MIYCNGCGSQDEMRCICVSKKTMTDNKDMPDFYPVKEFDNKYSVTVCGKVFSHKLNRFLKPNPDQKQYLQVCLSHKGITYSRKIHKLVAENILGKKEGLVINHKDGNNQNNHLSNLEYISIRENVTHGRACGKLVGATYWKRTDKWQSRITIDGKRILLGYFKTKKEAHQAYLNALKKNNIENKYAGQ